MGESYQAIRRFPANGRGRDYVVGDVHGEFAQLDRALQKVRFDPRADRLFSVGDLIDRGRDSPAALRWLAKPWFHAILGNHEQMALQSVHDPDTLFWWTRMNGGAWWLEQDDELRGRMLEAFAVLPLAIEVATPWGRVGIVHADIPPKLSWDRFLAKLAKGNGRLRETALWGRSRARGTVVAPVDGVDRIYCGHTPVDRPRLVGNVHFIDTGACYNGRLTVLAIDEPFERAARNDV